MNPATIWINRLSFAILSLAILTDAALYLYMSKMSAQMSQSSALFRFDGKPGPMLPPDGYSSKGARVVLPASAAGWVVRYTSKRCEHCKEDEPTWNQLATALGSLGYGVLVVVPSAKDEYPEREIVPAGAQQASYVNVDWIKRLRLTMTPTVMIFNPSQGLIWEQQGTLAVKDISSALAAVKSKDHRVGATISDRPSTLQEHKPKLNACVTGKCED
jgi:hypothetical protein